MTQQELDDYIKDFEDHYQKLQMDCEQGKGEFFYVWIYNLFMYNKWTERQLR